MYNGTVTVFFYDVFYLIQKIYYFSQSFIYKYESGGGGCIITYSDGILRVSHSFSLPL